MKRISIGVLMVIIFSIYGGCSDPCREAADKVKDCLLKFCSKYGDITDEAKMKCTTFNTNCPNGENPACGFDFDRCSRNNSLADKILEGECNETTGEIN